MLFRSVSQIYLSRFYSQFICLLQNIGTAMDVPLQFVRTSSALMSSKGLGVPLNESDYSSDEINNLNNTGIALSDLLDWMNISCYTDDNISDPTVTYNCMLQADVVLMLSVLSVSQLRIP